jgi:hypothetical protein
MKKLSLSAVITLAILLLSALAAWAASSATFTTPPREGTIFAVVNFDRALGTNRPASYQVSWGTFRRSGTVVQSYRTCATATPAGFVLMIRHFGTDATPFTLATSGTIVRGPYQGEAPPEISHTCYKLVKLRAVRH